MDIKKAGCSEQKTRFFLADGANVSGAIVQDENYEPSMGGVIT